MSDTTDNDHTLLPFDEDQASETIRRVWHEERWFFSVIDVVGLLTESTYPNRYWSDMKQRIQDEGFREVYAKCVRLKMEAPDGKQRLTDAADAETLFRIIQSIPSPKAEPFKRWLAKVARERLDEMENPELAADRMRQHYRALGYTAEWIDRRLQGIVIRDELTHEWHERGAKEGKEFAALTDTLQSGTFDVSASEHHSVKHIGQRQNLRDSMTTMELLLTALTEETAKELHQTRGIARDTVSCIATPEKREKWEKWAAQRGATSRRDIEARHRGATSRREPGVPSSAARTTKHCARADGANFTAAFARTTLRKSHKCARHERAGEAA